MDLFTQIMYVVGCLITGIVSIVAFSWGLKFMQEQEGKDWQEECKQLIETMGKQTRNASG